MQGKMRLLLPVRRVLLAGNSPHYARVRTALRRTINAGGICVQLAFTYLYNIRYNIRWLR